MTKCVHRQVITLDNESRPFIWYSEIESSRVEWLWYPYIPCGKISVIQGDPGGGKSMLMIDLIARLTTGRPLPDGRQTEAINVIYQCSEDGLEDTIKPRMVNAGADCNKVAIINEDVCKLKLDDEMIRRAILEVGAKMLVIDPVQAYLGDSDLSNATGMRRVMRNLGIWASAFNCAVVLVGHLNKKSSQNDLYRGLGSVDIMAQARSVLQVERSEDDSRIRFFKQVKNSLSSLGPILSFTINQDGCLRWISEGYRNPEDPPLYDDDQLYEQMNGKTETAALLLNRLLSSGPIPASQAMKAVLDKHISERTIKNTKKILGIVSFRKNGQWFWRLPNTDPKSQIAVK